MNILDLFRRSRLKINTPNGVRPQTYQENIVRARNVNFPPNISSGDIFVDYIRFEETGAVPGSPAPVLVTNFMVTETNDFLMTEDDNNLITGTEII